jgi:hypothetical protein
MSTLDHVLVMHVDRLTKEQLERAAEVFIHEGSSFAVSQGELWLSKTSMAYFRLRNAYIMYGENGPE